MCTIGKNSTFCILFQIARHGFSIRELLTSTYRITVSDLILCHFIFDLSGLQQFLAKCIKAATDHIKRRVFFYLSLCLSHFYRLTDFQWKVICLSALMWLSRWWEPQAWHCVTFSQPGKATGLDDVLEIPEWGKEETFKASTASLPACTKLFKSLLNTQWVSERTYILNYTEAWTQSTLLIDQIHS